jgi:hypothetical protein
VIRPLTSALLVAGLLLVGAPSPAASDWPGSGARASLDGAEASPPAPPISATGVPSNGEARDAALAQRLLVEARLAWQDARWDDALRLLSQVPGSRPIERGQAQGLSERVVASRATTEIAAAAQSLLATSDPLLPRFWAVESGYATKSDFDLINGNADTFLTKAAVLGAALRTGPGRDRPPVSLLGESGDKSVAALEQIAATIVAKLRAGESLTQADGKAGADAFGGFEDWSQYLILWPPEDAWYLNELTEPAHLIPYAPNVDELVQQVIAWDVAMRATSVAEATPVLESLADDRLAETARRALARRLADPLATTIFGVSAVPYWLTGDNLSPIADGYLPPGTVVDDLGEVGALTPDRTNLDTFERLRVPASGQVVYIRSQDQIPRLVRSDGNAIVAAMGSRTATKVRSYLASQHLHLVDALYGPLTGDNVKRLVLSSVDEGCVDCTGRWIVVWDIASERPLWTTTPAGERAMLALLPSGNGFEYIDEDLQLGDANCCPSRWRVTQVSWNGRTFVDRTSRELIRVPSVDQGHG